MLATFLPRCLAHGAEAGRLHPRQHVLLGGQDEYGPVALYTARFTAPENPLPADAYIRQAQANLDAHCSPTSPRTPETQFDIFFPPYSAAEWATMESKGTLESMLALRSLCYDALSGFANVTIYDFTTRADWVLDLNNYKDALHYGQWINDAITECIARGENVVADRETLDAATAEAKGKFTLAIELEKRRPLRRYADGLQRGHERRDALGRNCLQRQDAAVSGVEESLFVTGDTTTIAGTTLAGVQLQLVTPFGVSKKRSGNDGAFSFELTTKDAGEYKYTLILDKSGYNQRRVPFTVTRIITDDQEQEKSASPP